MGQLQRRPRQARCLLVDAEIPLSELASLVTWAKNAERCQNQKGEDCVKLRGRLMPKTSAAGNEYLLMALSDAKPKVDDAPF